MTSHRLNALWLVVAASAAVSAHAQTAPLSEVEVRGYREGDASNASKTSVPTLENAQAISVVSADLLKTQGITRLADALRNVAGVSRSSTYGFFDAYQIRGYDAAYGSVFLDGLRNGNVAGETHEIAGLEQVEVIKGPASGLFGSSPLGGVVNLVSKRPKKESFIDASLTAGSYDTMEATIDANGELTASGHLLGRLNVVYKDADEFVDFSHSERLFIAPAVAWEIAEDTKVTFLSRFLRDLTSPWSPLPAYGTILPNPNGELPVSFSVADDDELAYYNQRSTQIGYAFEHRFNPAFSVVQNLRYERSKDDWDRWIFASGISEDLSTIGRFLYGPTHYVSNDLTVDTRANFSAMTGSVQHALMFGVDYLNARQGFSNSDGVFDPARNPLRLFNPDYAVPLDTVPDALSSGSNRLEQTGFYVQDHVSLTEKFTLTLGGRWDRVASEDQQDNAFSPTIGATYRLTSQAALYANVAESFTPTPSWQTRSDGSLLPPETGKNIEGGVKVVSSSGILTGMASLFQLTRQNVATADPSNPFFYIVTGEQRSRGFELESAWRPTDEWDVHAAYSYIDAEYTKDNFYPVGAPLPNVPKNNLSLWGKYTVPAGPLARLGVSLGVLHNSDKHFFEGTVYTLPSYTIWDAGLSYSLAGWAAQLTVDNLSDERYFPDSGGLDRITPGEPRNWRLTLSKSF